MGEAFVFVLAVHVFCAWVARCALGVRHQSAGVGACDMSACARGDGIGNYCELS